MNHLQLIADYEPCVPGDAPEALFAERIARCQRCPAKQINVCTKLEKQLCSIVARNFETRCPLKRWPSTHDVRDVTVILTAFRRPEKVEQQVESIRKFYPTLPILIGDNGDQAPTINDPLTTVLQLPFDCGISAARNYLAKQVETRFALLTDDDHIWTEDTRLESLIDVLDSDPDVGVVGAWTHDKLDGELRPIAWSLRLEKFRDRIEGFLTHSEPVHVAAGGTPYQYSDTVLNIALFRRDVIQSNRWDEDLKVSEHCEYYWRFKQKAEWKVAFTTAVSVVHDRNDRREDYLDYRRKRERHFSDLALRKSGFKKLQLPTWLECTPRGPDLPNVLLLTPGHTGSSIVTHMMHQLGWNPTEDVDAFAEPMAIRELNEQTIRTGEFDADKAEWILQEIPQPWALKDPRFRRTIDHWLPLLAKYSPTLVYLSRSAEAILESHQRRGEFGVTIEAVEEQLRQCEQIAGRWPWPAHSIDFDHLTDVLGMFDQSAQGRGRDGFVVTIPGRATDSRVEAIKAELRRGGLVPISEIEDHIASPPLQIPPPPPPQAKPERFHI